MMVMGWGTAPFGGYVLLPLPHTHTHTHTHTHSHKTESNGAGNTPTCRLSIYRLRIPSLAGYPFTGYAYSHLQAIRNHYTHKMAGMGWEMTQFLGYRSLDYVI